MRPSFLKICVAVLGASLLMLFWGAMFWVNPLPYRVLQTTPDEYAAGNALLESFPESGTYLIPGFYNDLHDLEPLRRGPLGMVFIEHQGMPTPLRTALAQGFLLNLGSVSFLALLLWVVRRGLPRSYGWRFLLVISLGVISAIFTAGTNIIWWFHPVGWQLISLIYISTSWSIA